MLQPNDFRRIMESLRKHFCFADQAEIAIEADPRGATHDRVEAYKECGVTRASFGVQDFSTHVQVAINRVQSFATVEKAVNLFQRLGVNNINFDLMYGLPRQSLDDIAATIEKSLHFSPKRIAHFGYAHVPWMKKHMRLIHDQDLPDAVLRIDQFALAEKMLTSAGMTSVGLDHFVTADDDMLHALHARKLARNFQGYTTDNSPALIGLGMSSISRTEQGFFQNYPNITEYRQSILDGKLPCVRGRLVTDEDALRACIISDLMCYLSVNIGDILMRRGKPTDYFDDILQSLTDLSDDGLLTVQNRIVTISPEARQATRIAAARFDAYFTGPGKKHAQAA
jgi:oxygen-independent coproporphyrinogen-3 oxidase